MIKWLLVGLLSLLSLLVVGGVGYGLYVALQPPMVTAKAAYLVNDAPSSWNLDGSYQPPTEREIIANRGTMVALMSSPSVLSIALQNPELERTFLRELEDPSKWLDEHLMVEFEGDSYLLEVWLAGPVEQADDLKTIVKAVSDAFYDEVLMKARFERSKDLDKLKSTYAEYQTQLREKLTQLARVRTELGEPAADSAEVRIRELEIQTLERTFQLLADKIQQMELDIDLPPQIALVDPVYIEDDDVTDFD